MISQKFKTVKVTPHRTEQEMFVVKFKIESGGYAWDVFPSSKCPKLGDEFKIEISVDLKEYTMTKL